MYSVKLNSNVIVSTLNSYYSRPTIKFTNETKNHNGLPFLDLTVIRNSEMLILIFLENHLKMIG